MNNQSMLLYVHVPFCRSKCNYCAFSSQVYSPELEQSYLQALKKEVEIRSGQYKHKRLDSIYFGGGTPTILSISSLARIVELISSGFELNSGVEFTVEANPETVTDKKDIQALRSMGVNRISLGVQSLDDGILMTLGRKHSSSQALKAAGMIMDAGIDNLSLDLIWGLPGQNLRDWIADIKQLVRLQPKHISCYGLTLEPGTPLSGWIEENSIVLPADDHQARMYVHGAEYLESVGLLQYEVSNFARMGYACSHNMGYWEGKDYLGLGPSAVSSVGIVRWTSPAQTGEYADLARNSFHALEKEALTHRDITNERIMLSLRTSRGLKLSEYRKLTGQNFCRRFNHMISVLRKNHLVRMANGYFRLTRNGMLVSNSIIERFIS